ncbi:Hypothetical protein, putative [Bodo saltans]|uniref:Uncharacterized protein n=1 Tax=Bodo saltans TaxID=75058 RepID=A0A0S4IID3_BODSA|nr:Hypothetical protein, putative [Bodo saltans]|eukprot:CUE71478.1 Hypothetical protein, putative [Bodo saltans]
MPFVALSGASQPLLPETCRFLLVSETAADNCRPLHIPISDICRWLPTTTAPTPRIDDQHKLIVGKCRPELYWALERIPNSVCAWKHAAFWLDRDLESEQRSNALVVSKSMCAIHPSLPHYVLRVQCLGSTPFLITRFSDHSTVLVEPGQPQYLKAYDTVTFGDVLAAAPSEQAAVLRFLPVAHQNAVARIVPAVVEDVDAVEEGASMPSSLASSLLRFTTAPNPRSTFHLPDASVRRGGCITCTQITSFILSDVVTNLTIIGITSMPMVAARTSASSALGQISQDLVGDVVVPQSAPPLRSAASMPLAAVQHDVVVVADTPPPEKPPSHVSESDPDGSSCANTQTEPRALLAADAVGDATSVRRRLVVGTPQQPSTSKAYSATKRNSSITADSNVVLVRSSPAGHAMEISSATRLQPNVKRARSDSAASACSPSQARDIVVCPTSRLQKQRPHGQHEPPIHDDPFVMVAASLHGAKVRHNGNDDEAASSLSSSSSSAYTAGSLPDSFDDKWDEHLLALEAKSTVRAVPNVPSPVKLFGGPGRHPNGSNSTLAAAATTTIGRNRSSDHMVPPHSSMLHQTVHASRQQEIQDEIPPESQMVYFGHSQ